MKRFLMCAAAVALLSSSAMADLTGTSLDLNLVHDGTVGTLTGPSGGAHTYGSTSSYLVSGVIWNATSPSLALTFDNSMWLDFTTFGLSANLALDPVVTATFDVMNLDEHVVPGSVNVFLLSDLNNDIAISATDAGDSFTTKWDVGTIVADNPLAPGVVVAWNSMPVPAPGALALLGTAGLTVRRRRRRA